MGRIRKDGPIVTQQEQISGVQDSGSKKRKIRRGIRQSHYGENGTR